MLAYIKYYNFNVLYDSELHLVIHYLVHVLRLCRFSNGYFDAYINVIQSLQGCFHSFCDFSDMHKSDMCIGFNL